MPALRYSEDTEFNDALRARGILPQLPAEPESPEATAPPEPSPQELIDELDDQRAIEELELDQEIPAHLIDSWKSARLAELQHATQTTNARSSGLRPIGKEDYVREVNQASEVDVDPDSAHANRGTGVVLCLWNNSSASRHILALLEQLSHEYPSTRFLSIPGGSCIANYPDANQPTLICYRAGGCLRQYVGIGSSAEISKTNGKLSAGLATTLADLEAELLSIGALDPHLKVASRPLPPAHDTHEDQDDGDYYRGSKIKKKIRVTSKNDSDSELDI
ncbi:hypothetical protein PtA15_8A620 [Puccinia triticina]|uniref:Phosducin thioredoxin-like domain-containing protein n=1 Tax=Puccinia triticina TaxID=208348 RepID=A0ABY7CSS2_9BASI|nr:uncharacterized protein PtA15_8A620 [Puccinia triticina]WAQ87714.1 hypothetical protein PtA15_8A620 [Puccinia triticina]